MLVWFICLVLFDATENDTNLPYPSFPWAQSVGARFAATKFPATQFAAPIFLGLPGSNLPRKNPISCTHFYTLSSYYQNLKIMSQTSCWRSWGFGFVIGLWPLHISAHCSGIIWPPQAGWVNVNFNLHHLRHYLPLSPIKIHSENHVFS